MSRSNQLTKILIVVIALLFLFGIGLGIFLFNKRNASLDDRSQANTENLVCQPNPCGVCGFYTDEDMKDMEANLECPDVVRNGVVCSEVGQACIEVGVTPAGTEITLPGDVFCESDGDCQGDCPGGVCNQCSSNYCDKSTNRCAQKNQNDGKACSIQPGDIIQNGVCSAGSCVVPTPTPTVGVACQIDSDCQENCPGGVCNQCVANYCDTTTNRCAKKNQNDGMSCSIEEGGIFQNGICNAGSCSAPTPTPTRRIIVDPGCTPGVDSRCTTPTPSIIITPLVTPPCENSLVDSGCATPFPTRVPTPTPTGRVIIDPGCTPGVDSRCTTPTPTTDPECPRKHEGDANCDEVIALIDFQIFLSNFTEHMNGIDRDFEADFDGLNSVSLVDYNIWRQTFVTEQTAPQAQSSSSSTLPKESNIYYIDTIKRRKLTL